MKITSQRHVAAPPSLVMRHLSRLCVVVAVALISVGGYGCEEEQVRTYTVTKTDAATRPAGASVAPAANASAASDDPHESHAAADHSHAGPDHSHAGSDHSHEVPSAQRTAAAGPWSVPEGWQQVPGERPMRVATFKAERDGQPLEIAVSQFPGDVGGLLANVNRWRQQVGLEPITEARLASEVTPFSTATMQGHTMWLKGPTQHMLGAAISEAAADRTWFVKAVGSPEVVAAHRADVEAFARSFGASVASVPATRPAAQRETAD